MKTTLLGVLLLSACADLETVEPVETAPVWTIDHLTTDGALLGVWGSGPDDVWAVGGDADGPLVLHDNGSGWARVAVPGGGRLANIYGFTGGDVYAVGERGLLLHHDGQQWSQIDTGTDVTLFGLWGASADDVWVVGGDLLGPSGSAVVLRGAHGVFTRVADIPRALLPSVLFKVHGFGADNVMMVGSSGVLTFDGTTWRKDAVPSSGLLRAVWGRGPDDVYSVGGTAAAEVIHYDGRAWRMASEVATGTGLTGVFTSPGEPTIAVGSSSYVFEIAPSGELAQATLPELSGMHLHGVWGDGEGTTYVVGGDLYAAGSRGVVVRRH